MAPLLALVRLFTVDESNGWDAAVSLLCAGSARLATRWYLRRDL